VAHQKNLKREIKSVVKVSDELLAMISEDE